MSKKEIDSKNEFYWTNEIDSKKGTKQYGKCMCDSCDSKDDVLIPIQPGQFMCKKHFNEYVVSKNIPPEIMKRIKQKRLDNAISIFFKPPSNLPNAIVIDKPYEIFLPHLKLHFDKPIDTFDFSKFQAILMDKFYLVNAKPGSTIATIVIGAITIFTTCLVNELCQRLARSFADSCQPLIDELGQGMADSFGRLIGHPIPHGPNPEQINSFMNQPVLNPANIHIENDAEDMVEIMNRMVAEARQDVIRRLPRDVINFQQEYRIAERAIKESLKSNEYELNIIQLIAIDNREMSSRFSELHRRFPPQDIEERYLYHGCIFVRNIMVDPNRPELNLTNQHLLNGFYLTDNPFFATFNSRQDYGPLEVNEPAYLYYSKVFYNRAHSADLLPLPRESPLGILLNKGAIKTPIGNSDFNYLPHADQNPFAMEYIINDDKQILPLFILQVIRSDFCIIWRGDDLNSEYNQELIHDIERTIHANVYPCTTDQEVLNIVQQKKKNRIKFITNHASNLIYQVREILGSNFLCLVYSNDPNEQNNIRRMENVLFTTTPEMFTTFAQIRMDEDSYHRFINQIQNGQNQANINENEMLHYPHFTNQIPFNPDEVFEV